MGWIFLYDCPTKADLIRHLIRPSIWEKDGVEYVHRTIKHTVVGSDLWTVYERSVGGVIEWRYVVLYMMAKDKGVGWGYKDVDESMGMYQVNCPLSYLDGLSDPPCEYSREWREKVRAHHAQRAAKRAAAKALQPGDIVTIYGNEYTVYEVLPRGKLRVRSRKDGMIYHARSSQLTLADGEAA